MSLGSSKEGYGDGVTELTFTMLLNQKYIYIYIYYAAVSEIIIFIL